MRLVTCHILTIGLLLSGLERAVAQGGLQLPDAEFGQSGGARPDLAAEAATALPHLPRYLSTWTRDEESLLLPVFDGTALFHQDWLVVIGGFDENLTTTPAVQQRHPQRGWLPIGAQLREARARHTMTPLPDGRVLIVGGVRGRIGETLTPLASAEVLHPVIAGSVLLPPLNEPLVGHTAHRLDDTRIAIIGGSAVRIFDADKMDWVDEIPLSYPRQDHASVLLDDGRLFIVGGDQYGSIEVITIEGRRPTFTAWPMTLPACLTHAAATQLPDGRVLIVGGIHTETGRSTSETWLIDPVQRVIRPGPDIKYPEGIARPRLQADSARVIITGGEVVQPGERRPPTAGRLYEFGTRRLWSLAPSPMPAIRAQWLIDPLGRDVMFGGYRFLSRSEAETLGLEPGTHVLRERQTMTIHPPDDIRPMRD